MSHDPSTRPLTDDSLKHLDNWHYSYSALETEESDETARGYKGGHGWVFLGVFAASSDTQSPFDNFT
jgi:hypothetical protein